MADLAAALDYPEGMRRRYLDSGIWREERPWDWLADWIADAPDRPISRGAGPDLMAGDLRAKAEAVAAGLAALGLAPGDVVAVQMPNVPDLLVAIHGIQRLGAVPAMIHMPYRAAEIAPMMTHVGAKAVVCFAGMDGYDAAATMRDLRESVPALAHVIVTGGPAPEGTISLEDLATTPAQPGLPHPSAADPALILFTSGTSAAPKAVVHSYHTLCASARVSAEDMGLRAGDTVLCAPPFTHAFGLLCSLIFLRAQATAALMPAYSPPALAACIGETGATGLCVGPAHIMANLKAGLWTPDVTDHLRFVYTGGAVCLPEVVDALDPLLANGGVFQVWGMTEVLMPICTRPDAPLEERRTSLGQPPRAHDLRIADENDRATDDGTEGELQMRGAFLFRRYLDNPVATAEAFTDDGYFRTGDLARLEDGRVYITGRAKDLINRGGIKINPVDIEQIMENHPAVAQAAMIPYPDEVLGERACLVVVLAPDATLTLEEVRGWLDRHEVLKLRWPERLELVDAMPMTPTRKIIKGRLSKQILG